MADLFSNEVYKIKLSGATKGTAYTHAEITRVETSTDIIFQSALYTQKQVFHENMPQSVLMDYVSRLLTTTFSHLNAWDGAYQYTARSTKKGKILTTRKANTTQPKNSQEKLPILHEGLDIPVLKDIGIFTQENKIINAKRDKLKQINRFLTLIEEEIQHITAKTVNIIDLGCGKSYLTFLVYHYLTKIRGLDVTMRGVDSDPTLIEKCNISAEKYNYKGLQFITHDITTLKKPPINSWGQENTCNIIISLHACNTATDYTLYHAVQWSAHYIFAVPCCQHELRDQMQEGTLPLFSRYGIVQERVASLATDAIRAALLESVGYKVQIIELTDRENTAKNLMIRAKKVNRTQATSHEKIARDQVTQLSATFGFTPMLKRLLASNPSSE